MTYSTLRIIAAQRIVSSPPKAGNDLLEVELAEQPPTPVTKEKVILNRKSKIPKRQTTPQPVTILIPFIREIVPVVALAQQHLEVNLLLGLLEINESSQ